MRIVLREKKAEQAGEVARQQTKTARNLTPPPLSAQGNNAKILVPPERRETAGKSSTAILLLLREVHGLIE